MTTDDPATYYDSMPRRHPQARLKTISGKVYVIREGVTSGYRLNAQARAIWALCDGETTLEEMVDTLGECFKHNPRQLIGDVTAALQQLYESGVVELWDPGDKRCETSSEVDLRNIPVFVINCREDKERRDFMERQLGEMGVTFRFVDGVKCRPPPIGIALSHLKVLRQQPLNPPFLVLEDDCEFQGLMPDRLRVPAGTDALYLGVSNFGIQTPGAFGWGRARAVRYYRYDRDYLRILNMLSRHAVLFLSDRFHKATIDVSIQALTHAPYPYPGDIGYAMLQHSHLVLTPNEPLCRQKESLRGSYASTRSSIRQLPRAGSQT